MTACSLEPVRCFARPLLQLPFSAFSNWKSCSVGLRSGDWLCHWRIYDFSALRRTLVAFTVCFGSLSICTVKCHLISVLSRKLSPVHHRIHPATFISSCINNKEQQSNSTCSNTCSCIKMQSPCLTDHAVCFTSWTIPLRFFSFLFQSFW